MSSTIDQEKAMAADASKLIKFLLALKKFLAKQLLVFVVIAILSFPLASVIAYFINTDCPDCINIIANAFQNESFFMIIYIVTFIGLYFTYLVLSAIQTVVNSKNPVS